LSGLFYECRMVVAFHHSYVPIGPFKKKLDKHQILTCMNVPNMVL